MALLFSLWALVLLGLPCFEHSAGADCIGPDTLHRVARALRQAEVSFNHAEQENIYDPVEFGVNKLHEDDADNQPSFKPLNATPSGNPQFLPANAGATAMHRHAIQSADQRYDNTEERDGASQGDSTSLSREGLGDLQEEEGMTETGRDLPAKEKIQNTEKPSSRILAVVSAYKDDISWILAEDRGGNNWRLRVPTELYQVSDIGDDCNPTFPGLLSHHKVTPAPSWPQWAVEWALEKCALKKKEGINPGSVQDSERMAQQAAGLKPPVSKLENGIVKNVKDRSAAGSGVILFEQLTPVPLHLVPNKASESLGYLTAIINHYEDLPDLMLFMHGHVKSWHTFPWGQDWMLDRLASLPPRNLSMGYMQLGCIELDDHANRVFPNMIGANHWSPNSLGPRWHESFASHITQAWLEHLGDAFGQPLPPHYIQAACCASFAVTKQAILRRPKFFYEGIRKWVMETPMEKYWVGAVMEFTFHLFFTNLAVYDPPRNQCLCELYDICIAENSVVM